ncbi:hypothetical protein BCF74_12028 [Knoellia remsis]|uniref:Uncharacterized protein n=1 Tax=Knoellia remsis TaxID=407159 RepID=A0A2T0UDR0_9MICO|nr:hypothetical protein [Knoellia remsis]PRY56081.1 hypothetical protein BCF74_12028 [Knoellia remsis]
MSQTATVRPLNRAGSPTTRPRPLRVVREQPAQGQPAFVGACLALLVAGLLGVLMLNTAMAKGSFVLGDLQDRSNELTATEEALDHAIDAQSAPSALAQRALGMGMVPAETAAFLRLEDGKVLGVASAATQQKEFTVATQGNTTAAAKRPATTPKTTVRTEGTVTTTTVTTIKGDTVEVTKTSVDSRTGKTTTTTSSRPVPAAQPQPTPSASASSTPRSSATPSTAPSATPSASPSSAPSATATP